MIFLTKQNKNELKNSHKRDLKKKEANDAVLLDLCKPYNVDLSQQAYKNKRFFLGYVLLHKIEKQHEEDLKKLFKELYEDLEKFKKYTETANSNPEDEKKLTKLYTNKISEALEKINNIVPFTSEDGKKEGLIINLANLANLAKIKNVDNIKEVIDNIGKENIDDYQLKNRLLKPSKLEGQYTHIFKILKDIDKTITENGQVYVVVPHIPFIYIGKVKSLSYYKYKNKELAELLMHYYKEADPKHIKKFQEKYEEKEKWFEQRNFFGQLIQSFEVKEFKKFNYVDLPLSFLMIRNQAMPYLKEQKENEEFINTVKELYEKNDSSVKKKITEDLILKWFTPTSIEMLSTILLKYKNKGYEVYHTGGTGDNGMDIIGTKEGEVKFVAQCKTSFNLKEGNKYYEKIDNEDKINNKNKIKFYYIITSAVPEDESKEFKNENKEIWDKDKLIELIEKYHTKLKKIPPYGDLLKRYKGN